MRGISGEQVYHSDTFEIWVKYSIDPRAVYDPVPSEFYQIEDNITEINNNPPKPGESGYWLIWDVTTHQYKESAIPLPDGTLPEINADTSGKYLSNDGEKAYWAEGQAGTEGKIDKIEVNGVEEPIVDKTVNLAVPTKTSDLSNDSGYITNEALDGYATKAELPTKVSQLENDSKFINESALDGYAKTADIPTKTSQLNNDSGYITANDVPVKSVDGATGNVVTNAVKTTVQALTDAQKQQARTNIGAGTSSFDGDYNSLTNKPTTPTKTSELDNDSGFIIETNVPVKSVNGKIGEVTIDAKSVGALPDSTVIPSKTSELDNDSGYITNAALDGYAKTTDIPTKVSQLDNDAGYVNAEQAKNAAPVQSVNGQTGVVVIDIPEAYELPVASSTQLGGVKVGAGLSVAANGVLSAIGGGTADAVEWNNVLDKPTTITGYSITDAKIENGTITLGNQTITPLTSAPVTSVNSKTGAVVLGASDVGALPADTVIPTVNNATLTIRRNNIDVGSFTANSANDVNIDINVPTDKSDIGLSNVDNVKQYSATNPPPYPVTSVNGKTGTITVHEVPTVTTSDNGKFLRVVDGAWAAVMIANANGGSF